MCGIIGDRQSATHAGTHRPREQLLAGLDAALAAGPEVPAITAHAARGRCRSSRPAGRARPGGTRRPRRGDHEPPRSARRPSSPTSRSTSTPTQPGLDADELEQANADLITLKDAVWAIGTRSAADRPRGRGARRPARRPRIVARGYLVVQQAFSAIDRLEVRGRDSAGVHLFVWGHDIDDEALSTLLAERGTDPLFQSGRSSPPATRCRSSTRRPPRSANSATTRRRCGPISPPTHCCDGRCSRPAPESRCSATPDGRASASSPNRTLTRSTPSSSSSRAARMPPYVVAALNGDVDNHADLRAQHGLRIAVPITTDAKVIPTLMSRHLADGFGSDRVVPAHGQRIRRVDRDRRPARPHRRRCSSRCAAVARVCTSVSVTTATSSPASRTGSSRKRPATSGWTVSRAARSWCSTARSAGDLVGHRPVVVRRRGSCRSPTPTSSPPRSRPGTSTVAMHPHFLLKEISEAPNSFAKTLRGKIARSGPDGRLRAVVGERALPPRHRRSARGRVDPPRSRDRSGHCRGRRSEHRRDPRRADGWRPRRRRDHRDRTVRIRHARWT